MNSNTHTIGTYLKNLRTKHNYTQAHVATHLNIIRQTYSHYETGRIFPPTDVLLALTHLYEVPLDSFFDSATHKSYAKAESKKATSQDSLPKFDTSALLFNRHTIEKESELLKLFRMIEERDQEDILFFLQAKAAQYRNSHFVQS